MTEYHTIYKEKEGTTTEWEDLQVKYGNLPAREKPAPAELWAPAVEPAKDQAWISNRTEEELEELEDEVDDDRFLEAYRQQRLEELKAAAARPRFGSVEQIRGQDFIREVSNAPADVWVVVHLFKDSVRECAILGECLQELAGKYPGTKFVKSVSTDCIKNYPDQNLPTLVVYHAGQVKATLVGMSKFGGRQCHAEDVAYTLCQIGPVLVGPDGEEPSGVVERVQRAYVERLVKMHENNARDGEDDDE